MEWTPELEQQAVKVYVDYHAAIGIILNPDHPGIVREATRWIDRINNGQPLLSEQDLLSTSIIRKVVL